MLFILPHNTQYAARFLLLLGWWWWGFWKEKNKQITRSIHSFALLLYAVFSRQWVRFRNFITLLLLMMKGKILLPAHNVYLHCYPRYRCSLKGFYANLVTFLALLIL